METFYREVKASETEYIKDSFTVKREDGYVVRLEPIEITEEGHEASEWTAKHIQNSVYSSVLNELTVAYRAGFKAALSKLKNK